MNPEQDRDEANRLLEHLLAVSQTAAGEPPDDEEDSPLLSIAREFFANNWAEAADGLLRKTTILRVVPEWSAAPCRFHFEIDRPYKRKLGREAPVELMPGPIRGMIHYRPNLYLDPDAPYIAVQVDPELAFFHPNCSRQRGSLVCLGALPDNLFPFSLELLLETRVYPVLTYQDRQPAHPFDMEAAAYFALDPQAMDGLKPVPPLY